MAWCQEYQCHALPPPVPAQGEESGDLKPPDSMISANVVRNTDGNCWRGLVYLCI